MIDFGGAGAPVPLNNDVETYLMHRSAHGKSDKLIARFRYNTAFIHKEAGKSGKTDDKFHLKLPLQLLDPDKLQKDIYYN